MGTGICLFLHWENEIWVTGTGNHKHKTGNGNHVYTLHITCSSCTVAFLNSIEQQKKSFDSEKDQRTVFTTVQCLGVLFPFLQDSYLLVFTCTVVELQLSMRKAL